MQEIQQRPIAISSAQVFSALFITACALSAVLIGSFPLEASIVTIFLFAGVHNLMEFRYFVARMPVRWGRSRTYYSVGIGGVVILAASYITLYFASGNWLWSGEGWTTLTAVWNSGLVIWIAFLVYFRARQRPRTDWSWAFPAAFALAALAWIVPQYWSLSLVYIHPLVAMWFLERQIRRSKPQWLRSYHFGLAAIPVFLVLLCVAFARTPNLPEDSNLFWRITQHAGSEILPSISSHVLVATHVFLESVHYFVWILLLPLVDGRSIPWRFSRIPMFSNRNGYSKLLIGAFAIGVLVVVLLWAGFAVDYTRTRDIYFAFAMAHVLAEFPFLIKML